MAQLAEKAEVEPGAITPADAMLAEARLALAADLKRIAADPARRVFAVFDGAQFDDIDGDLSAAGLSHRSLYINVADESLVDAGPWLVDFYANAPEADPSAEEQDALPEEPEPDADTLTDEALTAQADAMAATMKAALEAGDETGGGMIAHESAAFAMPTPDVITARINAAVALLDTCPNAAVFWIGDETLTQERMWKHTRSINRVMIPREFADEDWDPPAEAASADTQDGSDPERPMPDGAPAKNVHDLTHTDVMFRHADGNVLAEVLPVLDERQFTRLFGPTAAVTFLAPNYPSSKSGSALRRAVSPDGALRPEAGFMRLSATQMETLELAEIERSRHETMAYLRDQLPDETADLDDKALYEEVVKSEDKGFELGLKSMTGHLLYAWLHLVAGPNCVDRASFECIRVEEGETPDAAMEIVFDCFIEAAEKDEAGEL